MSSTPTFARAIPVFLKKMKIPAEAILRTVYYRHPMVAGDTIAGYCLRPCTDEESWGAIYYMVNNFPMCNNPELYFEFEGPITGVHGSVGQSSTTGYFEPSGSQNVDEVSQCGGQHNADVVDVDELDDEPKYDPSNNSGEGEDDQASSEDDDGTPIGPLHPEGEDVDIIIGAGAITSSRAPPGEYTLPELYTTLGDNIDQVMTVDHYEGGPEIPDFDPTRQHFYIGQRFYTKKEASLAVKHWALHNNRALATSRSKTWELEVRCYSYKTNNCPWRLRVTSSADDGFWTVRQWNPQHTCDGREHNVKIYPIGCECHRGCGDAPCPVKATLSDPFDPR